jgi:hypothetical protein
MVAKYRLSNITEKALEVLFELKIGDPEAIKKELEAVKSRRLANKIQNFFKKIQAPVRKKQKKPINRAQINALNPFAADSISICKNELSRISYSNIVIPTPKNSEEIRELEEIHRELETHLQSNPEDHALLELANRVKSTLQKAKDIKEAARESVLKHIAEYETSRLELLTKIESNNRKRLDTKSLTSLEKMQKVNKKAFKKNPENTALQEVGRSLQSRLDAHKQAPKINDALKKQLIVIEAKLEATKRILQGGELSTDPIHFLVDAQSRLLPYKAELETMLKIETANKTKWKKALNSEVIKRLEIEIEALVLIHNEIKGRIDRLCKQENVDPQEFFENSCIMS